MASIRGRTSILCVLGTAWLHGAARAEPAAPPGPRYVEARDQAEVLDAAELELEFLLNAQITTASKTPIRVDEAPGSVTVITRQQLKDLRARTLREALNLFVPGMDVVPTFFRTGDRANEAIYSRGLPSDLGQQVLVLLNGHVKLNEATSGSILPLAEFPLENVERVEVSRTPIPLYGGAAITVVNVITLEQSTAGAEAGVELAVSRAQDFAAGGSAKRFHGLVGGKIGGWHAGSSLLYHDALGDPATLPPDSSSYSTRFSPESFRGGTPNAVHASASLRSPGERFSLHGSFRSVSQDALLTGLTPSPALEPYGLRSNVWTAGLTAKPGAGIELRAGGTLATWSKAIASDTPQGLLLSTHDVFAEGNRVWRFSLLGEHALLTGARAELEGQHDSAALSWNGFAFEERREGALLPTPNVSRFVGTLYAEDTWRVHERFLVLAGFALGYYAGFGETRALAFNPRVSLHFWALPQLMLKLLYASAPRPPSLSEQAAAAGAGRPALTNERAENTELGVVFQGSNFKMQLSGFLEEFNDRIELSLDGGGVSVAQNSGRGEALGADLEVWYYFDPRNYLFLNAAFVHSRDLARNERTPFLPSVYASAGVHLNFGALDLNLSGYFRGPRPLPAEAIIDVRSSRPTVVLNAAAGYTITDGLELMLAVDNVLGMSNEVPVARPGAYVPLGDRMFRLGVHATLD